MAATGFCEEGAVPRRYEHGGVLEDPAARLWGTVARRDEHGGVLEDSAARLWGTVARRGEQEEDDKVA